MSTFPDLVETFESGSNGVTVTTANTVFDAKTGTGTAVFTNSSPFVGALSCRCTAATNNISLEETFTGQGFLWFGFAMRVETAPSAVTAICQWYLADVLVAAVRLNTTRTLNFRDNATTRWTSAAALNLNEWYEVRVLINAAGDVARVKYYDDNGALVEDSGNLTLTSTVAASVDEINFGIVSGNVTAVISYDRLLADTTDEPAPSVSTIPYLYYDNGTSWVDVSTQLYLDNGAAWVNVLPGVPLP